MPVYEYRCAGCGKRFEVLHGMTAEQHVEKCPSCGGTEARRLVSRFARGRTEDQRLDEMADRFEAMGEPESPAEARALAREMGKALDDDMADDMEEMLEEDLAGNGYEGDD
jgi:putative FmdB family regulatory protein